MTRDWMKLFLAFHKKNPEFYKVFEDRTMELVSLGHRVIGNRLIFCQIRFFELVTYGPVEDDGTDYLEDIVKLNDAYASYYARMFMHRKPEHQVFRKRKTFLYEEEFSTWLIASKGGRFDVGDTRPVLQMEMAV